ncbi:SRPBCC family protein [Stackebrandtia soli]|uniref:SRPBCC family protein n=1 Tax=Stackebrandtia soli TaxID=1892856 RepID=UPI0039ECCB6A
MGKAEFIIEPGRPDIVTRRTFDATPDVVYRAFTESDMIKRWWGRDTDETIIDVNELKHGGRWRFISKGSDGSKHAFRGVYHDLTPAKRIAQTFEWEGAPGHVSLETASFTEVDGKTEFIGVSVFQSVEDRDAMAATGMEEGANEGYDRIDEILAERP